MTADRSVAAEHGPDGRPGRRVPLIAAAAVAVVWLGFLAVIAVRTANPVTVNRGQLLAADAVVVGASEGARKFGVGFRIDGRLAGDELPAEIRVGGIDPDRLQQGRRYVVPITEENGLYYVTPAPPAYDRAPLVYPATDDAVAAAKAILAAPAASPYQ